MSKESNSGSSLAQRLVTSIQSNLELFEDELNVKDGRQRPHLWAAVPAPQLDDVTQLPSELAFQLMEKIRLDLRALEAVIIPTRYKMLALAMGEVKASALNCATTLEIADAIHDLGGTASLPQLVARLDVNENKLGRVLRTLAQEFIFRETSTNVFENTRHSIALLRKQNFHSFLSLTAIEGGMSATGLAKDMIDHKSKHSFAEDTSPFTWTVSRSGQTFTQYCMQEQHAEVAGKVAHGVVPWINKTTRLPLLRDYPWGELGFSTVVDVGCGPGDSAFDIIREFPKLRWIFQDFEPVIRQLKDSIPAEFSHKVKTEEISFVVQDYFQTNVSQGDVWYLRGVIREYDDDTAIHLLKHLATRMKKTQGSRLLINEVLCSSAPISSTSDGNAIPSEHIPEKQSLLAEQANLMTWSTFSMFGGKERSYLEVESIIGQAGLRISRFFQFRSFTTMIECKMA